MSIAKAIHFVRHSCGPQECDCAPDCRAEGDLLTAVDTARTTCKNCLRCIEAGKKRKWRRYSAQIASHKAWADEARGYE